LTYWSSALRSVISSVEYSRYISTRRWAPRDVTPLQMRYGAGGGERHLQRCRLAALMQAELS
jgi:hypothetical protein